ncbi:MAG: hypothetical protein NWE76_09835 [Candidatus Bathyarchaeota archaeon]|nr:hypothetical protein [Candidatus Bathyarchaeota archaeon]
MRAKKRSWPPGNEIYDRDQQIAYANMLQQLAEEYDKQQSLLNPGFKLGPATPTLSTDMYPSQQAVEKSPELREERGRANPAVALMDFLTPVGDITQMVQGLGEILSGSPAMGAVNIGAGFASLAMPGGVRTGKASQKLAKSAGKKGVSVKAIKQAAQGGDVSKSEKALLEALANRAEKAGMTHVDAGNMGTGGLRSVNEKGTSWMDDWGVDRIMGISERRQTEIKEAYEAGRTADLWEDEVVFHDLHQPGAVDVIKLKGDQAVYGPTSRKHYHDGTPGHGGVHAHVRAVQDPSELLKREQGKWSDGRNVYTMLEIQSDAFQAAHTSRYSNVLGDPSHDVIHGSSALTRMAAETPDKLTSVIDNIEEVADAIIEEMEKEGFLRNMETGKIPKDLYDQFGTSLSAMKPGNRGGFQGMMDRLIQSGRVTQEQVDDFIVAQQREFGEGGYYDFRFAEGITEREAFGRRVGIYDEWDEAVDYHEPHEMHPWVRDALEVKKSNKAYRGDIASQEFLSHAELVGKGLKERSPMKKTWIREALAAYFEKGASKGAEAFRIPTRETVNKIQNYDEFLRQSDVTRRNLVNPEDAEGLLTREKVEVILKRYDDLPDELKKMGVDVSKITTVTDTFGNTWLEIPRDAVPSSVKVFRMGGKIRPVKAKSSGMKAKKWGSR